MCLTRLKALIYDQHDMKIQILSLVYWQRCVLVIMLCLVGQIGCVRGGPNVVTGGITPAHFRFKTVVPENTAGQPDGWQAVCIRGDINNANTGDRFVCEFEVGLPLRNRQQGSISLEYAQQVSARNANDTAYALLATASPGAMSAMLCIDFRKGYEQKLKREISGARVRACMQEGIETVEFKY